MGPWPRGGHALAYDSGRGRVVLFGGVATVPAPTPSIPNGFTETTFNDTWEWDGSLWSQMANFGPPARCDHVLVYDAARQQVLLFGGLSSQLPVADTWAWNGEDWTQLSDSGPPARSRHAAAYDSARQRVVLFGGQRTDPTAGLIMLGDTWEWDGQDWTQVSETGPSPRQLAVMAFDSARNKTVLFGGTNMFMDVSTGDTWEWDGAAWTRAADFGPPVGSGGAMVYAGNECVAFGGTNLPSVDAQPVFYPTTWGWDGSHWVLRQDMGPGPRWRHGMAFDGQRGTIVMFGGLQLAAVRGDGSGYLGDTWEHNGATGSAGQLAISGLQLSPPALTAGQPAQLTITLSGPAQAGSPPVNLSVDPPNGVTALVNGQMAPLPVQVRVTPGSATQLVQLSAGPPSTQATIKVELQASSKSVVFVILS
jgi:hypothetical protein